VGTVPPFCSTWPERFGITLRLALQGPQIHLVPMQEFWKVYSRIIVPISIVISNLLESSFAYFFYLYYYFRAPAFKCHILFPLLIVVMGILGLDWECLFPLVTKYRDFSYLIGFGVQCMSSAVVYPMALVKEKCRIMARSIQPTGLYYWNNPLYAIECWAHISMGIGLYLWGDCCLVISGVLIFNRTEKSL
jgi:lipopolysaccharide transport system permease protein